MIMYKTNKGKINEAMLKFFISKKINIKIINVLHRLFITQYEKKKKKQKKI